MRRLGVLPSWLRYVLLAVDAHSLHSPFLYHFYTEILRPPNASQGLPHMEAIRREMIRDRNRIWVGDCGTGKSGWRRISDIARWSLSTAGRSSLYVRICAWKSSCRALELGTSLGLNALYLSEHCSEVITFEGSASICAYAGSLFRRMGRNGIRIVEGDIGETLPREIRKYGPADFVLIDANHRACALHQYFGTILPHTASGTVLVIDDIRWSRSFYRAWCRLARHQEVSLSLDLGSFGLLFLGKTTAGGYYYLMT